MPDLYDDAIVEAVARAEWDVSCLRDIGSFDELDEDVRESLLKHARAALSVAAPMIAEKFEPLRAPIAAVALWRDTYPDGPDMLDTTWKPTPDHVRLARSLSKDQPT